MTTTLKRSHDRKVANLATPNGKQSKIQNAFGLPAGQAYSCPGATSICEKVCYAGKLEKVYKGVKAALVHNWELLSNASQAGMVELLRTMVAEFDADCVKRNASRAFRIHWDGDFFSREYARAWAIVVAENPTIQFWVYTRSFTPGNNVVDLIADIPNLAVYLSVDDDNREWANVILDEYPSVKIAVLSETMELAGNAIADIRGDNKPGAKCPELIKSIPLISDKGGACFTCQLCPQGKSDIRFSFSRSKGKAV
jgi:hypothetical protein